jgi:lipid-binding SYLF domain-containing protein
MYKQVTFRKRYLALIVISIFALAGAIGLEQSAAKARTPQNERTKDAARHAEEAAKVFKEIMGSPDKSIPQTLLDKAEAIAVFPGITKAGFIVGGRGGQGVISRRVPGGWSEPAFFNLGGGSVGAQIGVEKVDAVMLFMNENAVNSLLKDKFEIGGELGATAGPVGRNASASTDAMLQAGILSYSRSKGLFVGAVIKGAVISPDDDLNKAVYSMTAKTLLSPGRKVEPSQISVVVRIFPETLASFSKT